MEKKNEAVAKKVKAQGYGVITRNGKVVGVDPTPEHLKEQDKSKED
jgi:hypothetical protein